MHVDSADSTGAQAAKERSPRWASQWHVDRARRMVREHPEIKGLIGTDARTALVVTAVVVVHWAAAALVADLPWWAAILLAWAFGTVIAHALGVAIHELAHDLVFRKRWLNKAFAIFVNLPLGFPGAIDFRDKHLRHHRHLGDLDGRDTQAPTPRQEEALDGSPLRRLFWLTFGPLVFHGGNPDQKAPKDRGWLIANVILCFAMWPPVFLYSSSSFLFLFFSSFLAFGPHPVGIRRYAEHVALVDGQPTCSYYGGFNRLSFNVGLHVEHHDFPGIPWTRIGQLRTLAPAYYLPLAQVKSWTALLVRFFLDRGFGVGRYVQRDLTARMREVALAKRTDTSTREPSEPHATSVACGSRPPTSAMRGVTRDQ